MFHTAGRQRTVPRTKVYTDKENALPSKTPSRATGKAQVLGQGPSTVGVNRLAPGTVLRDTRNLMGTTNGKAEKGKGKETGDGKGQGIEPTRLFKTHITASKSASGLSQAVPAPRQTPATTRTLPAQTPLPSAGRTSRRSRQSFATPIRQDGWDDDLASGNVSVEIAPADVVLEGLEEESDGDVEYMPPKAVELPYEPPFEHADLAFIGRAVASRSQPQFSRHLEDFEPDEELIQAADFALPDVEEPLFAAAHPVRTAPSGRALPTAARPHGTIKPVITSRIPSTSRPAVGTTAAASRPMSRPVVNSRGVITNRKPALPSTTRVTTQPSSSGAVSRPKTAATAPSTGTRKTLAPVVKKATSTSTSAPARKAPLPVRRVAVSKPKADPLADLGINYDDVLAELGNDDFQLSL